MKNPQENDQGIHREKATLERVNVIRSLDIFTSLTCPGTTPLMRQSSQGKAGAGIYQYLPGPGREPGSTSIYEIYT